MYHINSEQKVGRCSAKPGQCPFGGESEHFDTALSAKAEVERRKTSEAEQNSKVASKRKRKVRGRTNGTASDNPDQTSGDGKMSDRSRTIGVNWQPASDHEAFFSRLREEFQVACQNGYISERFSGLHRVWLSPPTHEDDTSSSPSARVRVIIYHGVREDFAPKMRDVPFHSIEAAVSPSYPAVLDPGMTPERQNLDVALMKDPELADHIQKLENIMSTFRGTDFEFEIDTEFGLPSDRLFSQHMMMRCLSRIREVYPDTIRAEKRDEALQVVKREADTYAYHYSRDCYFKGLQEKREKLNRSASEITPEVLEQDEVEYAKIHTSDLARAERYIALGDHLDRKFPMVYKSKVLQVPLV